MLAGVGTEINERLERYNDTLWRPYAFSRRSATSACAIALVVMAVTPYHRFSSSIGLASGAMTWLVILAHASRRLFMVLRYARGMRRPRHLGAIGVFLGVIATVPEWVDLAFYARGDSIPFVFAPIWLLHGVSCVSCSAGALLLSYVIWDTAGSPLTQGRRRPTKERIVACRTRFLQKQ